MTGESIHDDTQIYDQIYSAMEPNVMDLVIHLQTMKEVWEYLTYILVICLMPQWETKWTCHHCGKVQAQLTYWELQERPSQYANVDSFLITS